MKESLKDKYPLLFENNDEIDINARYQRAWQEAKHAADILKDEFGAEEIWLFGSLTDKNRFYRRSDIDLAEKGIPDHMFYSAVARVTREIKDFKVDLIDIRNCREVLKSAVEKEGIKL
ncbi:MAG: nucleotidyltransferase family protein [bacterium]